MLICVDHGNKNVKTGRCAPFTSGLVESETQPFGADVLKYKGKYYQLSDERLPYRRDKTEDEKFFILTLFAIARELETVGGCPPGVVRVQLAIGLPPAHYSSLKARFDSYFSGRGAITFAYRDKQRSILIDEVACYPQSYAAAVTMFQELKSIPRAVVLDLGGYTVDYLLLKYGAGDLTVCDSLENGVILLYNRIRSKVRSDLDILISETEIDAILMGAEAEVPDEAVRIAEASAQEFITNLLNTLREHQIELKTGRAVFVGGGALLLRSQIIKSGKVSNPIFVEDIAANAKGYEFLYQRGHGGR